MRIRRKLPKKIRDKVDASKGESKGWSFTFPKDPPVGPLGKLPVDYKKRRFRLRVESNVSRGTGGLFPQSKGYTRTRGIKFTLDKKEGNAGHFHAERVKTKVYDDNGNPISKENWVNVYDQPSQNELPNRDIFYMKTRRQYKQKKPKKKKKKK